MYGARGCPGTCRTLREILKYFEFLHVSETILGAGNTAVNKTDKRPTLKGLMLQWGIQPTGAICSTLEEGNKECPGGGV